MSLDLVKAQKNIKADTKKYENTENSKSTIKKNPFIVSVMSKNCHMFASLNHDIWIII